MEKRCPDCATVYYEPSLNFYKDSHRADGFNVYCKICVRRRTNIWARKNRDKRRYEKAKYKVAARGVAQNHYAEKVFKCAVLTCECMADDLHHVDYNEPLAVVPLCKRHHTGIHGH